MHALARLSTLLAALLAVPALAHEGHGIASASHWHATDGFGWIAAAVAIAVGVWLSRK
jgi:hypothetical protein